MTAPRSSIRIKKPPWLRRRLPSGPIFEQVNALIQKKGLHTVCTEAKCPNQFECFGKKTATFLILGNRCTRDCGFCHVKTGPAGPPDPSEPVRVAESARLMDLKYVVITSVTRDDLPDGGAAIFSETIKQVRSAIPGVGIEVLIPDFQGKEAAIETVVEAAPDVINHNIETVRRHYPKVRPQAVYERSLQLLQRVGSHGPGIATKSGLMLGLGETRTEIIRTLEDLRNAGCQMLTLGQYLQPSASHLPVIRFVPPQEFEDYRKIALELGFTEVASGPMVRSSYHAERLFHHMADRPEL